jgi:hypothetical protein
LKLEEYLYKGDSIWVSENPRDIHLTEYGFDPEDVPPVLDLLSCAPRIRERDSGIRYHLNAMGVTCQAAALETHFQKGSPHLESSRDPKLPEGEVLQEGSSPNRLPEAQNIPEPTRFPTERRVERLALSTNSQEVIDE